MWKPVGRLDTLPEGTLREFNVDGLRIVLARVGDDCYAFQALCPHMRAELSRGTLDGYALTCAAHGSMFDIRNGENTLWIGAMPKVVRQVASVIKRPQDLQTYPVKIEEDDIYVDV